MEQVTDRSFAEIAEGRCRTQGQTPYYTALLYDPMGLDLELAKETCNK